MRAGSFALVLATCVAFGAYAAPPVTGRIHDAEGHPLKDVTVSDGRGAKTFSDAQGGFSLAAGGQSQIRLLFEAPGYYPETVAYERQGAALDVVLTANRVIRQEVKVVGSRLDISLASNPAATTVVGPDLLAAMPRAIAIDEALKTVPGVKVDNQADGERVHLSIRGQGILSEHGIRGIQIMYDGLPLNDPSGFAPDVYDVDWAGVEQVNVVRGPVGFLYGGGSAGGVIDIRTRALEPGPTHGSLLVTGGSNGFYKTRGEISGQAGGVTYLLSGSRTAGDGYRQHTAYWGNNVYGRLSFRPAPRLRLTPFFLATGFFNENAEGLNLAWGYPAASWWMLPNPDALTFNEYQRTVRGTGGFAGQWEATGRQRVSFNFYARRTAYKEPVPSSVEHRDITAPGGSAQYELESGAGRLRNRLTAGVDLDGQWVDDLRHPNLGGARESAEVLANSSITQSRTGAFWTNQLSVGRKLTLLAGLRFDRVANSVSDRLRAGGLDLSGSRNFSKMTARVGATRSLGESAALFASWGQGFLPPATEELYANPAALGGFNRALAPATSMGAEVGVRGHAGTRLFWEAEVFRLDTKRDFERYRIDSRPLETFYANAGESRRYGLEAQGKWLPARRLTVTAAYTYSHFTYTRYSSLTYPGALAGNDLPNSPRQQAYVEASWEFANNWMAGGGTEAYSRAFIDPTNRTWIDGYGLINLRLSRSWQRRGASGRFFFAASNVAGKRYIAFTEPDPDGNSYQPGANRELFGGIEIRF